MKLIGLLFPVLFIHGCSDPVVPPALQKDVDSITVRWVPDVREAVGNVNIEVNENGIIVLSGETDLPVLKEEITGYLKGKQIKYIDRFRILPDSSINGKPWGLVSVSVGNIKASPSHSAELVSQAVMGTPLKLLKRKGSWLLIQTPDNYIGWINDSSVREMEEMENAGWRKSNRLIFLGKSEEITSGNSDGDVVSDIVSGTILINSGKRGGYYIVTLPDGRKGFIPEAGTVDFAKWCSSVTPDAENLIAFSRSLTGYPYLWGGTSTKAMDCSGFTRIIYFTGGIILSRDASQQFLHGKNVDISTSINQLQPGDLVFFGYLNSEGIERIIHTGMYIGDTEVIHSSGMVSINSLDSTRSNYSPYLGKGLRGARRIIGSPSGKGMESVSQNNWYIIQK